MAFMDLFRKKTEEPKADAKQRADQARQSGQKTANQIDAIFCKNINGKISEEKVATYNQIMHSVADNIRHSETMDVEIENVDAVILKLVGLIRNSVEVGYDKLATEICEKLQTIIVEDRSAILATDESQRNAQIERRNKKVGLIGDIFERKFQIEQNKDIVEEHKIQLAEKLKEGEAVTNQLDEFLKKNPKMEKKEILPDDMKDPVVREFDNIKHQMVNNVNMQRAIRKKINDVEGIIVGLKRKNDQDKMLLVNESKFIYENSEDHEEYSRKILEDQLAQTREKKKKLTEESEKFDAAITEDITSQESLDEHIRIDLAFRKIMEERAQKEEEERENAVENTAENTENKILN